MNLAKGSPPKQTDAIPNSNCFQVLIDIHPRKFFKAEHCVARTGSFENDHCRSACALWMLHIPEVLHRVSVSFIESSVIQSVWAVTIRSQRSEL
jgi:hypothetical protein